MGPPSSGWPLMHPREFRRARALKVYSRAVSERADSIGDGHRDERVSRQFHNSATPQLPTPNSTTPNSTTPQLHNPQTTQLSTPTSQLPRRWKIVWEFWEF